MYCWEYPSGNSKCPIGATVLVAEGVFTEGCTWPPNERKSVTVAALHIHNIVAKLPSKEPALTHKILDDLDTLGVSIVHADFNRMSDNLMNAWHDSYICIEGYAPLGAPEATGDCCGFLLNKNLQAKVQRHGTWDFDVEEAWGISVHDNSAHYPNFLYLNSPGSIKKKNTLGRIARNDTKKERKAIKRAKAKAAASSSSILASAKIKSATPSSSISASTPVPVGTMPPPPPPPPPPAQQYPQW